MFEKIKSYYKRCLRTYNPPTYWEFLMDYDIEQQDLCKEDYIKFIDEIESNDEICLH
jgi:hypothetical protein